MEDAKTSAVDPVVVQQPGTPRSRAQSLEVSIPGCPQGLEPLVHMDQVLVRQDIRKFQTTWDKNKFKVLDRQGQQVYYVMEESTILQRMYCGPARGFLYHFLDNTQKEVLRVHRVFRCCTGCYACVCDSCRYFASVKDCNGEILGHISNLYFCCTPLFGIFDCQKNLIATIKGPFCPCQADCCTADIDYHVIDKTTLTELGVISKQWLGLLRETYSDLNNFRIAFPADTNVKMKALMLGAVFIIDVMMYERKQK